jgi:multiple antibiotic resistance protein
MRVAVVVFVLLDPVRAAVACAALTAPRGPRDRAVLAAVAAGVAALVLAGGAALADPLLDWLDVSTPAAQLAAGIVALVPALEAVFAGPGEPVRDAPGARAVRLGVYPLAVPVLAGPAALAVVVAWAAAEGGGTAAAGTAIAVAACAATAAGSAPAVARAGAVGRGVTRALGGLVGVGIALVAADLVHDGVFGA